MNINSVVNKILEGADVRSALSDLQYLVSYGKGQIYRFNLTGDLYGIDEIIVENDDSRTKYKPTDIIYCSSADDVFIYSFVEPKPEWLVSPVSGKTYSLGKKSEAVYFSVPSEKILGTALEGELTLFFDDTENAEAHRIDLAYSKGWCKKIDKFYVW